MAEIGTDIFKAKKFLESEELVAIPTETVYGLAGNALNADAVTKIFQVKNRPTFDPLIVHTNTLDKVKNFVEELPSNAVKLAEAFWPGPLTLLLPKKSVIPDLVTSGLDRVAVRIPKHPLTLNLLNILDFPVAAPSANPFGYISPTKSKHVNDQLGKKIPYILDGGQSTIGIESTIIGFEEDGPVIYRLGGMSIEEIENVIGKVTVLPHSSSDPLAPGMLKSHYAPHKPIILGEISKLLKKYNMNEVGILSYQESYPEVETDNQVVLSETGDLSEAARNLFSGLRHLDHLPIKIILAEFVPDYGLGRAINDRLRRAAAK